MDYSTLDRLLELKRDGQLTPAQHAQLEHMLTSKPEAAAYRQRIQAFDTRLAQALQTQLDAARLSSDRRERIRRTLQQQHGHHISKRAASALLIVLTLLIGGPALLRALAERIGPTSGTAAPRHIPATPLAPQDNGNEGGAAPMITQSATPTWTATPVAPSSTPTQAWTPTATLTDAEATATVQALPTVVWDDWTPTATLTDAEATATVQALPTVVWDDWTPTATLTDAEATATEEAIKATTSAYELRVTPTPSMAPTPR